MTFKIGERIRVGDGPSSAERYRVWMQSHGFMVPKDADENLARLRIPVIASSVKAPLGASGDFSGFVRRQAR